MSRKKPLTVAEDLLPLLVQGIKDILTDAKATPAEKLKAIEQGGRLVHIEAKISSGSEDESFFERK